MALGDLGTNVSATGTLQISVTYTCPQDGTVNTTPAVSIPMAAGGIPQAYGVSVCTGCGKRMLIGLQPEALIVRVQQTS